MYLYILNNDTYSTIYQGAGITAILVALLTQWIELSNAERNVMNFMNDKDINKNVRWNEAILICFTITTVSNKEVKYVFHFFTGLYSWQK
jgi:hypothetical protein